MVLVDMHVDEIGIQPYLVSNTISSNAVRLIRLQNYEI